MWFGLIFNLLNLAPISAAPTTSSSKPTVTVTETAQATSIWVTSTENNNAYQVEYHQVFTAYWDSINVPKSGSIGLGWISGSVGESRSYPLTTATDAAEAYSAVESAESDVYSGPLVQSFSTNTQGYVNVGKPVAVAGYTQWFGPSYTQNSDDLTGWGTTTKPVYATLTTAAAPYGSIVTIYDPDQKVTATSTRSRIKNPNYNA